MIDLKNQLTPWFTIINSINEKVSQTNLETIQERELINYEAELGKFHEACIETFENMTQALGNLTCEYEFPYFINNVRKHYSILLENYQQVKLALLFRGIGVNQPIQVYLEKYPLKDRVLYLGCGHLQNHHSPREAYCLDNRPHVAPDATIDITSPLMDYIPAGSFSKVVLKNLDIEIFNDHRWQVTFSQLHRILAKEGNKVKFNSMLDLVVGNDFDNAFILSISMQEVNSTSGKLLTDCPDLCLKYNQKLKDCFASVNFQFSQDFDMKSAPQYYTIYKVNSHS